MGMSASQARYLGLTARRNNNEFQAQQINHQRLNLAQKTEDINKIYSDKMSNTTLQFTAIDSSNENSKFKTTLTYSIITSSDPLNGLNMRVVDKNGNVVVPSLEQTYDKKYNKIYEDYETEKVRTCFTNTNSEGKSILFTGQNFMSTYLSGLDDSINSVIADRNGDPISNENFKRITQNMSAADFYDYWQENQLQYTNTDPTKQFDPTKTVDNSETAALDRDTALAEIEGEKYNKFFVDEKCNDADYLEEKLRNGEWLLQKVSIEDQNNGQWVDTMWQAHSSIIDAYDTADDAAAQAEYEVALSRVQKEDKQLELELKQLDTEHNALQTEIDSVKKVIEKNVEGSFKTFA